MFLKFKMHLPKSIRLIYLTEFQKKMQKAQIITIDFLSDPRCLLSALCVTKNRN
jgi:hypothetical protein